MATTHDDSTRIAIAAASLSLLELGTVYPQARLIVYAGDNTILAIYAMSTPAFPTPSDPSVPSNAIASTINIGSGVPHHFALTDKNGTARIFGQVGVLGSGAEIEALPDPGSPGQPLAMNAGDSSTCGNVTYQAPP